jgi:hypothetical protein
MLNYTTSRAELQNSIPLISGRGMKERPWQSENLAEKDFVDQIVSA